MSSCEPKCACHWAVNPRAKLVFKLADLEPVKLGYEPGQGMDTGTTAPRGRRRSRQGPPEGNEAVHVPLRPPETDSDCSTTSVQLEGQGPSGDGGNGASDLDDLGGVEWYVEKIVDKKMEGGVSYYLIKWMGWPSSGNTWEPLVNLTNSMDSVLDYDKREDKQKRRKREEGHNQNRARRGRGSGRGSNRGIGRGSSRGSGRGSGRGSSRGSGRGRGGMSKRGRGRWIY